MKFLTVLIYPVGPLQFIDFTSDFFSLFREHVELENLQGEHARLLEETKKEKVLIILSFCSEQ